MEAKQTAALTASLASGEDYFVSKLERKKERNKVSIRSLPPYGGIAYTIGSRG